MIKPKILIRNRNSIKISWENVFEEKEILGGDKETYIMEIYEKLTDWRRVYWGYKPECTIDNLEPCTCYKLRLKQDSGDTWLNFKAATDFGPHLTMNMTRAVRFHKIPLLKKIVHARPILLEFENKEFKTPLMQVAEIGDVTMATLLISLGANVNTVQLHTRRSPLMTALYYGQIQIANLFKEKGADLQARDINHMNILHYAVNANRMESVHFALEQNCDVNSQDNMKFTPIIRAVILHGNRDMIKLLFDKGANPDLKDRGGFDFAKHCKLADRKELCDLIPRKEIVAEDNVVDANLSTENNNAMDGKMKKQFYIKQAKDGLASKDNADVAKGDGKENNDGKGGMDENKDNIDASKSPDTNVRDVKSAGNMISTENKNTTHENKLSTSEDKISTPENKISTPENKISSPPKG